MNGPKSGDGRLRKFEADMHAALKSWHDNGGRESFEPGIVEMPFEDLLREETRDQDVIDRILQLQTSWQQLQLSANQLAESPTASALEKRAAQKHADDFYAEHEQDFALLTTLEGADQVSDYDWSQRVIGVRLVFRWILAEGFRPLKIMKRLFAIGRAMKIAPFTTLTFSEQARMFGEGKAAVSFRMGVLSGLIRLRGMIGGRLPGQKSPHSRPSYSAAQQGNTNRATGRKRHEVPRLRTLKPTTSDPS